MNDAWMLSRRHLLKTLAASGAMAAADLGWWEEPLVRPRRAWGAAPVRFQFSVPEPKRTALVESLAQRFNQAQHDFEVKVEFVPQAQARQKLISGIAANNPPDCCQVWDNWVGELEGMGAVEDLTPRIKEWKHAKDVTPIASDLPGHADVPGDAADRAAALAVARARPDRHLPGADLLELLVHGAVHGLDARGLLRRHPRELEESALIDGCGRFGALCRVVLPLAAPGIAATAIFAFVTSWSELLFAITFTTQTEMRTLSAGLLFMRGQYEIQWGQLSAGVMISTVPVAMLFTYLQRHLIRGLSAGAIKG